LLLERAECPLSIARCAQVSRPSQFRPTRTRMPGWRHSLWTRAQRPTWALGPVAPASPSARTTAGLRAFCPFPSPRASDKGFLPMTLDDYLSLLDWTGRQVRDDKRGAIPEHLAPILQRLQIAPDHWTDTVRHFGRLFRTAAWMRCAGRPRAWAANGSTGCATVQPPSLEALRDAPPAHLAGRPSRCTTCLGIQELPRRNGRVMRRFRPC
jgi:hypothetical protein